MIVLSNLVAGYKGYPILKIDHYEFQDGKIYGILGASGCGKSTLLKTICGLIKPLSGSVNIDGETYKDVYHNPVYMMEQSACNLGWKTCTENVMFGKAKDRNKRKANRILEEVGLHAFESSYPTQLSGGMNQRLAAARMLYVNPKFLLMDEPLSALDCGNRTSMQQLIIKYHRESHNTIIMVTHDQEEAKIMCDKILNLEECVHGKKKHL